MEKKDPIVRETAEVADKTTSKSEAEKNAKMDDLIEKGKNSGLSSYLTQRLACSVKNIPAACDFACFGHIS